LAKKLKKKAKKSAAKSKKKTAAKRRPATSTKKATQKLSTNSKHRPARLIVLSAPSGAGKSTMCQRLVAEFPQIRLSISTTTRPRRPAETDGVHYHFVSPETFEQKIANNEFAEWAEVHGNRYGTAVATIDGFLKQGKHVLFDIDVQGAMNLRKRYGKRTLLVVMLPPSMEELRSRLEGRKSDSPAVIEKRMKNAYSEVEWSQKFDHQITNDHLERAYAELVQILRKECL
jgi:guanylate kinase